MRVLVAGWFSFLHGEATAGDVLAADHVCDALRRAGIAHEVAWSEGFRRDGLHLSGADPARFSHLVFVCGPLHSVPPGDGIPSPLLELHRRFREVRRIAVGVSVPDPDDPAATGFHLVLPRDGTAVPDPVPDLACRAPEPEPGLPVMPVVGVILTGGQREYGARRRHDEVNGRIGAWLCDLRRGGGAAALLALDTRLDAGRWWLASSPAQLLAVLGRLDAVVTTRLHGLVLALRAGVPVLAVDPVRGGAKVTAQARALGWPAVLGAEEAEPAGLTAWWSWCLSARERRRARDARRRMREPVPEAVKARDPIATLLAELRDR